MIVPVLWLQTLLILITPSNRPVLLVTTLETTILMVLSVESVLYVLQSVLHVQDLLMPNVSNVLLVYTKTKPVSVFVIAQMEPMKMLN
jgi:hypothetical protein